MKQFIEGPRIAYFSMEIGISNDISTYSGGLGVLAGDIVRASADLRLQMVALTLVSRKGYFKQRLRSMENNKSCQMSGILQNPCS